MSYFSSWKSSSQEWQRKNNPEHPEYGKNVNGNLETVDSINNGGNGLLEDILPPQVLNINRSKNQGIFDCKPMDMDMNIDRIICNDRNSKYGDNIEYIGRDMTSWNGPPASKYQNPYKVDKPPNYYTREQSIGLFVDNILPKFSTEEIKRDLKGKHLLCWCSDKAREHGHDTTTGDACHGDILSHIANHT
jgi:hypothetical protein